MSRAQEPHTDAEWQDAVDGAAALRVIADFKMYGLLEGGPVINVARCDQILERGRRRGVHPSRPVAEMAAGYVLAFNEEAQEVQDAAPRK